LFIRTIRIENFIPYYGQVEIQFPSHEDRNVYLIVGDNGYGKTSFLKAVNWAFFGGRGARENERLINSKAVSEGCERMSITVMFEEGGETYTLTRECQLGRGEIVTLGTRRSQDDAEVAQDKIREILPQHTARFFIFEGEMVRELARAQGQEQAKNSIEILLGLQALRDAAEDLRTLEKDVLRELRQAQSRNEEFQAAKESYSALAEKAEEIEHSLRLKTEKLSALKNHIQELEGELAKMEELRPLLESKESLEKELGELEQQKGELVERRKELVKGCHLLLILSQLQEARERLRRELEEVSNLEDQAQEAAARRRLLEASLADDRCALCGHSPVDAKELGRRHQQLDQETVATLRVGDSADVEEQLRLIEASYEDAVRGIGAPFKEVLTNIDSVDESIKAKDREVKRISEKIGSFDHEASRIIRETHGEALKQVGALDYEIDQLLEKRADVREQQVRKQTELKRYGDVEEKHRRCVDQLRLVKASEEAFEGILRRSVVMNRERILEASNHFFAKATNKPQEFDRFVFATAETYAFQIVRKDGHRPDMDMISDGEKEIVALSFVLGLSKYSQIDAPLIMDGVNSRLDGIHRCNLAKLWSTLDNQVILLGIDKDFDQETRQLLADAICREYEIVRKSDEYSVIEGRTSEDGL